MKVIIAIDQSAYWHQVIQNVAGRHWPKGTIFRIMTVIHPFQWEHLNTPEWEKSAHQISEARRQQAQELLCEAEGILSASLPTATVETELEHGNPSEHVLHRASEWLADKIVVGAHHHSPSGIFGAVPRAIMSHAPASVELVRLTKLTADDIHQQVTDSVGTCV